VPVIAQKKREEKAAEEEMVAPSFTPEEGYEAVPEILPGTSELRHENQILFVTNYALEKGGVTTLSEFASWMSKQMVFAKQSGFVEEPSRFKPDIPEIEVLAKYLRSVDGYTKRS